MATGKKSETSTSSSMFKRSSNKKKKRTRKSTKGKLGSEQERARCVSPLVYSPEASLQELLQKYKKKTDDLWVKDIGEYDVQKTQRAAVRMGLSNQISRFEIPMDLKLLENMTVHEYLRSYCRVCKRRQIYYKEFFDKFDKDRDGVLSMSEAENALNCLYLNEIQPSEMNNLMTVITADENTRFDSKLFFSLCALSERLLYATFVTEETSGSYSEKQWLETADLSAIEWKFAGCKVNYPLKNLLSALVYKT